MEIWDWFTKSWIHPQSNFLTQSFLYNSIGPVLNSPSGQRAKRAKIKRGRNFPVYSMSSTRRQSCKLAHVGKNWPWPLCSWTKFNTMVWVLPLVMTYLHVCVKFENDQTKSSVCFLSTWMSDRRTHSPSNTCSFIASPPVRLSWDNFFFIFQSLLPVH